ncbi:MAG: PEP-CTERM sorting domain-containing protein [Verrucomicrobiales bacterium]
MKTASLLLILGLLMAGATVSQATLSSWQNEVNAGTPPAATLFATTSGSSPIIFNVGNLSGDSSFEFIVHSGPFGASQALMGTQNPATGQQGLKFEQWQETGMYGITDFGLVDHVSTIPYDTNRDVHIVFTSDGLTTNMYIDGAFSYNFGVGMRMTGNQGLAAATNATETAFFDLMDGNIIGFASYDSALSPAEITDHFDAFTVVPEPASVTLIALGCLASIRRRRSVTLVKTAATVQIQPIPITTV